LHRNSSLPADLTQGSYGGFTSRIRNSLAQQIDELRNGRLGTRPQIPKDGRYLLANKRALGAVQELMLERLHQGVDDLMGSAGPFLLFVLSQGMKGLPLCGVIALIQCPDLVA